MAARARLLTVVLVCAAPCAAAADTVVLGASRDTTLYAESGSLSNGGGSQMFTGLTAEGVQRRALVAFDIASSMPAGSTITNVSLTLRLTKTRTQNLAVSLYRVTAAWGEAGSIASGEQGGGGSAQTGDATWTMRSYPSTAWNTAGGDYNSSASATLVVGDNLIDYTWSSPAMVTDVQGWLATPSQGWIVIAPSAGTRQTKRFATRNQTDATVRPRLSVTFTPPNPVGACCAADGSCTVVDAPGTTCTGSYQGSNTVCVPNSCPQPTGACCAQCDGGMQRRHGSNVHRRWWIVCRRREHLRHDVVPRRAHTVPRSAAHSGGRPTDDRIRGRRGDVRDTNRPAAAQAAFVAAADDGMGLR